MFIPGRHQTGPEPKRDLVPAILANFPDLVIDYASFEYPNVYPTDLHASRTRERTRGYAKLAIEFAILNARLPLVLTIRYLLLSQSHRRCSDRNASFSMLVLSSQVLAAVRCKLENWNVSGNDRCENVRILRATVFGCHWARQAILRRVANEAACFPTLIEPR